MAFGNLQVRTSLEDVVDEETRVLGKIIRYKGGVKAGDEAEGIT